MSDRTTLESTSSAKTIIIINIISNCNGRKEYFPLILSSLGFSLISFLMTKHEENCEKEKFQFVYRRKYNKFMMENVSTSENQFCIVKKLISGSSKAYNCYKYILNFDIRTTKTLKNRHGNKHNAN